MTKSDIMTYLNALIVFFLVLYCYRSEMERQEESTRQEVSLHVLRGNRYINRNVYYTVSCISITFYWLPTFKYTHPLYVVYCTHIRHLSILLILVTLLCVCLFAISSETAGPISFIYGKSAGLFLEP